MWIAGTIGVHLAGNVQKISLHLYKSEQGLIMERTVRLNSTSLKAKRVRMFQTVTWFLFFLVPSFSLSLYFIFFSIQHHLSQSVARKIAERAPLCS